LLAMASKFEPRPESRMPRLCMNTDGRRGHATIIHQERKIHHEARTENGMIG
jgi:hypothetical protein